MVHAGTYRVFLSPSAGSMATEVPERDNYRIYIIAARDLFFHDNFMGGFIDFIELRAFEQVEAVDIHIDEFFVIERLVFLLTLLFEEDYDAVLHLFTAHNFMHALLSGIGK
jgi:hypothetical protein